MKKLDDNAVLSDLIRIWDERTSTDKKTLGDSNYYYYDYMEGRGIMISYTHFDDSTYEVEIKSVIRHGLDIQNCKIGLESKREYYKNRLSLKDHKPNEKNLIKNKIDKINENLQLFDNHNYDGFLRKLKIMKILD